LIRGNRLFRNAIGIFFCWGVKFGLAEGNTVEDCQCVISLGHRDTDNLICLVSAECESVPGNGHGQSAP
jgi:nitrous oxidase accessory protein NosD